MAILKVGTSLRPGTESALTKAELSVELEAEVRSALLAVTPDDAPGLRSFGEEHAAAPKTMVTVEAVRKAHLIVVKRHAPSPRVVHESPEGNASIASL